MIFVPVVFVVIFGLGIAGFVYWIVALIEVAEIPETQFRVAGTEKLIWVLVVALAGIIGALVWLFAMRQRVLAARGMVPAPPPGWYPEAFGAQRWWDGSRWTDHRHAAPPPHAS